jgi:hypothetical protein
MLFAVETDQQFGQLEAVIDIEMAGRFIEKQYRCVLCQRARQQYPLQLATTELGNLTPSQFYRIG